MPGCFAHGPILGSSAALRPDGAIRNTIRALPKSASGADIVSAWPRLDSIHCNLCPISEDGYQALHAQFPRTDTKEEQGEKCQLAPVLYKEAAPISN